MRFPGSDYLKALLTFPPRPRRELRGWFTVDRSIDIATSEFGFGDSIRVIGDDEVAMACELAALDGVPDAAPLLAWDPVLYDCDGWKCIQPAFSWIVEAESPHLNWEVIAAELRRVMSAFHEDVCRRAALPPPATERRQ